MPLRNRNIKTYSKWIKKGITTAAVGGNVVPLGMKRWVTFVMVDAHSALAQMTSFGLRLASAGSAAVAGVTAASAFATANVKLAIDVYGSDITRSSKRRPIMIPPLGPDPENPLFCIAGGKCLGVAASNATANVFIQYFDE